MMRFNLQLFALPDNPKMKFPPNGKIDQLYSLHSAWYSGDTDEISRQYTGCKKGEFWSKETEGGLVKMHIPVAGDVAGISADVLFSDFPEISIPEAEDSVEGEISQERLDDIIELGGVHSRLIEAAETCAALGGVLLKPTWDTDIADFPILAIDQVDNAILEFKFGFLVSVTYYREVACDEDIIYRHLEKHEKGLILNGLYKGSKDELGDQVDLALFPDTENLMPEIQTGWDGLMVKYVPNMKPNRLMRGSAYGQSDFAGAESLMDSLDETYSSWMRDIRLAKARMVVPESFLEFDEKEQGPTFDAERAVYTKLNVDPVSAKEMGGITLAQFDIRTEKHLNTALELLERIVVHAGYSPQTFGLKTEGRAESGTALNIRERRTYITRQKKWKYWKPILEDVLEMMLFIDQYHLGHTDTPQFRPSAKLSDNYSRDAKAIADAISTLDQARAISIETKVRMAHPDWDEDLVMAEVDRIKEENMIGTPPADPADMNTLDDEDIPTDEANADNEEDNGEDEDATIPDDEE